MIESQPDRAPIYNVQRCSKEEEDALGFGATEAEIEAIVLLREVMSSRQEQRLDCCKSCLDMVDPAAESPILGIISSLVCLAARAVSGR
jgi:hypothetical protein